MLRRVPLHLPLVAAFPVLLLWALNATEVWPVEAGRVLGLVVALATIAGAVLAVALRDVRRGALVAAALAAVVLGHGHLWGTGIAARVPGLLVAVAVVAWIGVAASRASDRQLGATTLVLNVVAVLLVIATVPSVVGSLRAAGVGGPIGALAGAEGATADAAPRDIVWIVPDRYGGQPGLSATFGIDNQPFVESLEQRGFAVADDARANYPRTSHSLAAQLNLVYLDDLAATIPDEAQDDVTPLYRMLTEHRTGQLLTDAGYTYVHLGSWWGPTATAADADVTFSYEPGSEFATVFEETTILPALGLGLGGGETTGRDRIRATTSAQLDELDREAARIAADLGDAPRFVFAHVALPHEPYVFDRDGSPVDEATEQGRERAENFARQLDYTNERLLSVVDTLGRVDEARAPVVIIQADEGPHPATLEFDGRTGWRWADRPVDDLVTKLSILTALRLPGRDAEALVREDISGVNAMRVVLDEYLGTDLGQLPDRTYIYPDEETLYVFEDVTDVLDEAIHAVDSG